MNKIEKLIAQLCPNGVKFKMLGEIASYTRGVSYKKSNEEIDGPVRVLRSNNITLESNSLNFIDVKTLSNSVRIREDQWLRPNDILISAASGSKEHVGKVAFIDKEIGYSFGAFMAVVRSKETSCETLNQKFLYYLLSSRNFEKYLEISLKSTTINNLNAGIMKNFLIPIPPLEIQQEIVNILDTFSELEAELKVELNAELEARRKQYQYYRDKLLSFEPPPKICNNHVFSYAPIKNLSILQRGKSITRKQITDGNIPVVAGGRKPAYFHGTSNRSGETIVVAGSGAYAGYVSYWKEPIYVSDGFTIKPDNSLVVTKYIFYVLKSNQNKLYTMKQQGGGVPHFYIKNIESFLIPVPPLEVQHEIVSILDNFDALVNDLSIGIPAEIAARRKQYKYYRDKLLTFKEAV